MLKIGSFIRSSNVVVAPMANAAVQNVDLGAQIIDINMGCPAKKVCKKAAGSALLRDEILVPSSFIGFLRRANRRKGRAETCGLVP